VEIEEDIMSKVGREFRATLVSDRPRAPYIPGLQAKEWLDTREVRLSAEESYNHKLYCLDFSITQYVDLGPDDGRSTECAIEYARRAFIEHVNEAVYGDIRKLAFKLQLLVLKYAENEVHELVHQIIEATRGTE
jgi:hypothetical protein